MEEKVQRRQEQIQQQPQQDLQQHLSQLRSWDLQADQSMEQRREQQKEVLLQRHQEDIGWLKQYYTNLAPAQAAVTAAGRPLQELPTPKLSMEEKRRNSVKRKQAKSHHPEADEITFDIAESLIRRRTAMENSLKTVGGMDALHGHGYDCRVVMDLCQGYRVDKNGNPADEEEARKMREDKQFLEDYDSKDAQRRKPHLDRYVDEVIGIEVQEWMFEVPYVVEHAVELRNISQKLLLIENIKKDNQEYFEELKVRDPLKYKLLEAKDYLGPGVSTKLSSAFQTRCVDMNNDTYMSLGDTPKNYEDTKTFAPEYYADAQVEMQKRADAAVQEQIDKRIEERRQEIARLREEILRDNSEAAQKIKKAGLTADNKPDSATTVLKYQDMILNNRERYTANQAVVDQAYAELFRAIDTKDDLMTQIKCTLEYGEDFAPEAAGFATVQQYVGAQEAELKEIVKNIGVQIECLENLLKHILRGDQLEASGTVAATRFGYHQQIENLSRTDLDAMENTQYRSTMVDEQGREHVTLYTKEDQNITLDSAAIQKETVHYTDQQTKEKKTEEMESAQTSAQYSYAYKTQASAIGRLLWMGTPPHADQLAKTHAKLSALGSKMYEPIEIRGKDKQARLESAGDQIAALQDEIAAAIENCEDYVKLKFGWGKKKKAAKELVEETLKTLREDYKKLDGRIAQLMYRAAGGEMTFGELLGDARATVIDLDREKEKLGKAGANMSDVITVGEGAEKLFYKEEETLLLTTDVFQQKFMTTKEAQMKYGKLLPLLRDAQNMSLNKKLEYPELEMVSGVISDLIVRYAQAAKTGNFEANDQRTQMLIGDFSNVLKKFELSVKELTGLLRDVAPEMMKVVVAFENMTSCAKISVGSKIAVRNVATSRMATLLGAGGLVAKSTTALVQEKGKQQRKGIVMERARGQSAADVDRTHAETKVKYSPDAVRQLVNLHLLDLVCGQTDRHMNNYFVTMNQQGQIDGVQGIDNDVAFGGLTGQDIKRKTGHLLGVESMHLPVVDQEMYESICSLTTEVIQVNFADLLSQKEINALADRIRTVREYLTKRIEAGTLITVEKDQWTTEHAAAFKGKYQGYVDREYL